MQMILMLLTFITLYFLSRNIFRFLFAMENYNVHKKRLKQLKFQQKKETDATELIDTITKPIITHVFRRLKPKRLDELAIKLKMAKWDKNFTPIQYRALNLLLKVLGVVFFLLLLNTSKVFACLWGGALCFLMDFLFNNSVKNRKEQLLMGFPDFIRITTGYLSVNMPIEKAVEETIKYVHEECKPVLQSFVIDCNLKSVEEALDNLKVEVDLFEVREFVALVKLTIEQGGDAKDSFIAQATKIQEMLQDLIAIKVGKRQMMGIAIQAPLLLCNLAVFGLPTIASMATFTTM